MNVSIVLNRSKTVFAIGILVLNVASRINIVIHAEQRNLVKKCAKKINGLCQIGHVRCAKLLVLEKPTPTRRV